MKTEMQRIGKAGWLFAAVSLLAAGDALLRALTATQEGIGCGCGGDYGLCDRCSKADTEADEAAEAWEAAKKAANSRI